MVQRNKYYLSSVLGGTITLLDVIKSKYSKAFETSAGHYPFFYSGLFRIIQCRISAVLYRIISCQFKRLVFLESQSERCYSTVSKSVP